MLRCSQGLTEGMKQGAALVIGTGEGQGKLWSKPIIVNGMVPADFTGL